MSKKTLNFEGFSEVVTQNDSPQANLVLASSSPYRQAQIAQLGLTFSSISANIDETAHANEPSEALALRLSQSKAEAVAAQLTAPSLVIGSDQTAACAGQQLEKPGSEARAVEQLLLCSGNTVVFYSGICVLSSATGKLKTHCTATEVVFRQLSEAQVRTYIKKEQPLDCAGSFKCEGQGIRLFEAINSSDPSALVGLPLIALCNLLIHFNYPLL